MTDETYFADSSFLLDLLDGKDSAIAVHNRLDGRIVTGSVCLHELAAHTDIDLDTFETNIVVDYTREDARKAKEITEELEERGQDVNQHVVMIAAQALNHDASLITRDPAFKKIQELEKIYE